MVTAYFPSPVTLTAGTSYVLRFEAANSGIASVTGRTSNPCPDGKASFSTDNGVTYADTGMGSGGADYYFWLGAP